jgi:hypothetical protein
MTTPADCASRTKVRLGTAGAIAEFRPPDSFQLTDLLLLVVGRAVVRLAAVVFAAAIGLPGGFPTDALGSTCTPATAAAAPLVAGWTAAAAGAAGTDAEGTADAGTPAGRAGTAAADGAAREPSTGV